MCDSSSSKQIFFGVNCGKKVCALGCILHSNWLLRRIFPRPKSQCPPGHIVPPARFVSYASVDADRFETKSLMKPNARRVWFAQKPSGYGARLRKPKGSLFRTKRVSLRKRVHKSRPLRVRQTLSPTEFCLSSSPALSAWKRVVRIIHRKNAPCYF